ncbi:MAG: hypothetical protein H0T80_05075 [Betaproteobacteria bacterium]|nr:hypothetical protein [Betaproteobacteria bacterium]
MNGATAPSRPSGWLWSAAAALATIGALALLAIVLAFWGWRWFGPSPVHVRSALPTDPAATIIASGLFNATGTRAPVAGKTTRPAATTLAGGDTRLLGVIAEREGQGWALFRLPTGPRLVAAGQEIAQSTQLVAVHPDGVTVRDGSGERDLVLRAAPAAPATVATANAPVATKTRNPACLIPAGFQGPIVRLNAELLAGMIAQPETWKTLAVAERGSLVVRDGSGFAAMLGMSQNDRIAIANGIALTSPEDVIGAVLKPLIANQAVRLTGARDGGTREWLLLNAGACPA